MSFQASPSTVQIRSWSMEVALWLQGIRSCAPWISINTRFGNARSYSYSSTSSCAYLHCWPCGLLPRGKELASLSSCCFLIYHTPCPLPRKLVSTCSMNEVAEPRSAADDNSRIVSAVSVLPDGILARASELVPGSFWNLECLMNIFRFVLSDCDVPPPDVVITGHYTLASVCRQWWALSQDGKN